MPRTPDRRPGESDDEGIVLENRTAGEDPTVAGGIRYVDGSFRLKDAIGVFNPRSSAPGGSNTQVQFNDSGTFSGSSLFTFNKTTGALTASYFVGNGASLTNITGSNVYISGSLDVLGYLQLQSVGNVVIPTDTTAGYMYVSGSTNDIYFTQYQPGSGFNNTTRLRWLEGTLTTGLLHGGILSTANGSTTFSITSGSGLIVSYNATVGSDPYPTINFVSWPTTVSASLTYVTSSLITYIGINASGGIIQQNTPFTLSADSDFISIGRVLHQSGSVTNGTITAPIVSYGTNHWQDDFTRAFGPLKVSGHILSVSSSGGVGTLGLIKTGGDSYVTGRNYTTNPNNPNNITSATDTTVTVSKIFREYVSGSSIKLDTGVANAGYTTIDPTLYNNAGTLTAVTAGSATIQRVYWYPNSATRAFTVYYGTKQYPKTGNYDALDVAIAALTTEQFTEGDNTVGAAILVGYIVVLPNATNLGNTTQARILQAGISRGSGAGGAGGVSTSTTPGGLDTYVQFNDGGSTFEGDSGLTYNKTTDTLTIAGDLAVNGGNLTSTSTTFNLLNSGVTTLSVGSGATTINMGNSGGTNTISGSTKFPNGLSGSLTHLSDGTSYLIAGGNVTVTTGSNGSITLAAPNLAPVGSPYLTIGNDATLTNERSFTPGTGLTATDGGANGSYTVNINDSVVATISGSTFTGTVKFNAGLSGSLTKLVDGTSFIAAGTGIGITSGSTGQITVALTNTGSAGTYGSATQVPVFSTDAQGRVAAVTNTSIAIAQSQVSDLTTDLANRALTSTTITAGTGLTGGGDLSTSRTLAIDNSVVATISGSTFTGAVKFNAGLSGSLTKLTDGTSYIIAGTNISVVTGSSGAVTISNIAPNFYQWNELSSSPKLNTTASVALAGGLGSSYAAESAGTDAYFFVSGTIGGATQKKSIFGGDVFISGSVEVISASSPGTGGAGMLIAGSTKTTATAEGRSITVGAGAGTTTIGGGSLRLNAGASGGSSSTGGAVTINAGNSTTTATAGSVTVNAGDTSSTGASANAGNINIYAGSLTGGSPAGQAGAVEVRTGAAASTGTPGNLTLTSQRGKVVLRQSTTTVTPGTDAFFYVTGTIGGTDRSVFAGDVLISGSTIHSGNLTNLTPQTWTLASSTTALNIASSLAVFDTTNARLGIGTTPDSKFHVAAAGLGSMRIAYNGTSVNYFDGNTQYFRATDGTNRVTIDTSGNVSIGDISAGGNKLAVNGNTSVTGSVLPGIPTNDLGSSTNYWRTLFATNISGSLSQAGATAGSIFFAGTNGALSQNNTSLFWDATNASLGIGTNSWTGRFFVSGSSTATDPNLVVKAGTSGQTGYLIDGQNSSGDSKFSVDPSGNVSIGGNLTVNGTTTTINSTIVNIGDNIVQLNTQSPTVSTAGLYVADTTSGETGSIIWDSTLNRWKVGLVGAELMFPTGSGTTSYVSRWTSTNGLGTGVLYDNGTNVGVGSTNPSEKLTVSAGGNDRIGLDVSGSISTLTFGSTGATAAIRTIVHDRMAGKLTFNYGNNPGPLTNGIVLDSVGNVGINNISPTGRFHVSGSSVASTPTMIVQEGVVSPTGGAGVLNVQNSAGTSILFVSGSSRVGIVNTSPLAKLHVGAGSTGPTVSGSDVFISNAGTTNLAIRDSTNNVELMNYVYSGGGLIGTATAHSLGIRVGNSTKLTLDTSGNATLENGNLIIGTSGKGIDFSITSDAAGKTAELFDDYEKGTWTPTLSATGNTWTYTTQTGNYTKVGDTVFVNFNIVIATHPTTAANRFYIIGLPFTPSQNLETNIIYSTANLGGPVMILIDASGLAAYYYNAGVITTALATNLNAAVQLIGSIKYKV